MLYFLPQYTVLAMCKEAKGNPGEITWELIARKDGEYAEYCEEIVGQCYEGNWDKPSRLDLSLIMLIAVMSQYTHPKHSVRTACAVYKQAYNIFNPSEKGVRRAIVERQKEIERLETEIGKLKYVETLLKR